MLVTGGAGFIGRHVARRLLALGASVRVADNLSRERSADLSRTLAGAEVLVKDLLDPAQCDEAVQGMDTVFHMASRVGPSSFYVQHPMEVLATNLLIDTHVLQAAARRGVERYFYPSSVFVYPTERQATPDTPPLREEEAMPPNPPVSYGWAKVMGEKLVEYAVAETGRLRAAIGRLIGVYGPGQDIDLERGSIIPVLLRRAYEYPRLQPFTIRGNGEETRSYCYIDDVVDAVLLSVERLDEHRLIGPLNIGSEGRIRIIDLAREVIAVSGKPIELQTLPGQPSVWGQAVDCSLARQYLKGWTPRVSLREGLQRTYEDVKARLEAAGTTAH